MRKKHCIKKVENNGVQYNIGAKNLVPTLFLSKAMPK